MQPPDELTTFADVDGMDAIKQEVRDTVGLMLEHPDEAERPGTGWQTGGAPACRRAGARSAPRWRGGAAGHAVRTRATGRRSCEASSCGHRAPVVGSGVVADYCVIEVQRVVRVEINEHVGELAQRKHGIVAAATVLGNNERCVASLGHREPRLAVGRGVLVKLSPSREP